MSPRLKSVISSLYRPALGKGRRVFAVSRAEAEQLPRLPAVAVVSITAPARPPASLEGFDFLLRLQFEDVDFLNPDLSNRAKEKMSGAFTADQAALILGFVESLPESIHTIVIHCEGGFSRSSAVALSLHRLYDYQVEIDRLEQANPSVVAMLTRSASSLKKSK
ncbi:hypothetical protein VVD49_18500 [Uliginosibacterium sp. H3]|uniref:Tyrosine specific protein phosphatases domain-containing protein n=1 Tax=Uliginosibacterium silvisoli TaxID=3114758 RepID=A0ABU6K7P8_9RHOO|nr:hypothetical protein [Uliginosibacterium sp. H3]